MRFASVSGACSLAVAALFTALAPSLLAAEASSASAAASAPLRVWVDTNGQSFDAEKLRADLSRELGREVTLSKDASDAAVRIKLESASKAQVQYTTPSGEALARDVELPPDRARSVQVVSWLTVNLVRDEASELLDALRARRKEEAEARALAEKEAADKAVADKAVADKAAADKAAADKAAADKAAADKAAADKARKDAEQNKLRLQLPPPLPPPLLLRDFLRSFDLAIATPLSIVPDSPKRELYFQAALGYGDLGALRGAAVTPSVLRVRHDVVGAAVGVGAVIVGGNARGLVAGVGYGHVEGNLEGALLGVGAAFQRGKLTRGVVAGVGGAIAGDVDGAVLGAGIASARTLEGVAMAGGITVVRGPSTGVAVAGGVNFSSDHRGVEVAGGINIARDLEGIAVAPLNVHRRVKGLQVGVINIAEEVDGAQIGIVSLSKNGRFQPIFWGSNDGSVHLALKSISGYGFTQIGGGINLGRAEFGYDGGVGGHFKLSKSWFIEPGVHYSSTQSTESADGSADQHLLHYLVMGGWRVANKVDLLAGGGARQIIVGGSGAQPEIRVGMAFF